MESLNNNCLVGAVDMHVHTSPDVLVRSISDLQLAKLFRKNKMGGFVIKSHHSTSYGRAAVVSEVVPEVTTFGGISLNNSLGGLNPQAVDTAGRMGAKIIWMPTVDAINEKDKFLSMDKSKLPYWASIQQELYKQNRLRAPVDLKNSEGKFKDEVYIILDLIKEYNMILATGHLQPDEGVELVREAKCKGIDKMIVTHPEFPTTKYTLAQQSELVNLGAFLERCYTTPATKKIEWDYVYEEVMATGVEHNILSTDLGQEKAILPPDGLRKFLNFFIEKGMEPDKVKMMTSDNQRKLLLE